MVRHLVNKPPTKGGKPQLAKKKSPSKKKASKRRSPAKKKADSKHKRKAPKSIAYPLAGITKPAIRRLCRRAGVKRISNDVYQDARGVIQQFLDTIIGQGIIYMEHAKRKTIMPIDITSSLKRSGDILY